jgi:hypothetical protein
MTGARATMLVLLVAVAVAVGGSYADELDSRVNGGIQVRLVWCEHDGRVLVTIDDSQTSRHHCIEVPEGERALHVFHHPYAYVSDTAPPDWLAE